MINSFLELRKLDKLLATVTFCGPTAGCPIAAGTLRDESFLKRRKAQRERDLDTLLNIKAFLTAARAGSFSAAARELGVAPSVIVKRINRLEDQMRAQLFVRSTRKLSLTETGERYFPRYQTIVGDVDDALNGAASSADRIEGQLRIKCPTTLAILNFGEILNDFQVAHPGIAVDLVLIDRSVNPVEEDFDIAIGAMPASYANVIDEPLSPYPRVLCAAPSYLDAHGEPKHPIDLIGHDCLTFQTTGSTWSFESPRGLINVDVRSRFSANDSQILQSAACRGLGIAMVARYIARPAIEAGHLRTLLPDYPVPELWLKALIPSNKIKRAAVQSLLQWIRERMQPLPSWAV
ncbi:LysR family transcriptional regulator [Bradyrhizobium sp. LHD-71]|uniref:LysR family transcriptional regulator n=1 Tax=Bradyrhizobium sp. LHD-71 TaxID=3072141 RepID=UPI00280CE93F|nr:LysR family transcriptional regulator [Bradyrhizobium sp. LHD-71]MDQ8730428.1 LysR family transcriptional regulator [Bradyrhizobium sp. LHD-71]